MWGWRISNLSGSRGLELVTLLINDIASAADSRRDRIQAVFQRAEGALPHIPLREVAAEALLELSDSRRLRSRLRVDPHAKEVVPADAELTKQPHRFPVNEI